MREIGRFAYLWAWPLVNVFNRYTSFQRIKTQTLLIGGVAPVAPINRLAMLHDYISPRQRYITCPAQDLVYGFGILDLEREPVVVQVPDFGQRYWVYQATDLRTDGFAELGAMYGTKPGFYPARRPRLERSQAGHIAGVFISSTNIGTIVPRVFQHDDKADNAALQPVLQQIVAYPLSEFDGTYKTKDWSKIPSFPWIKLGDEEWKWVDPATFFDVLPQALDAARPLPGEEAIYALVRSVLDAAGADRSLRKALKDAAAEADEILVKPLLQFRNSAFRCRTIDQSAARDALFLSGPRSTRIAAHRRRPLHSDLQGAAAGRSKRLLVDHALQQEPFLRAERDRPLLTRHQEPAVALRGRRLPGHPCAEGPPRRRPCVELAAGARRRVLTLYPRLLAARRAQRRRLDAASRGAGLGSSRLSRCLVGSNANPRLTCWDDETLTQMKGLLATPA
ncbi:MAG: DUF1254 domain-containing protein [Methyloceanibacter sp.]